MSEKKLLHRGRHVNFVERDAWEYAERRRCSGIVLVVPLTDAGEIVLVEQYRIPVQHPVIELVAGLAGDQAGHSDEDLVAAARRELLEETGFHAEHIDHLTAGPPSAGIADEVLTLYKATGLTRIGPGGGDASEAITVHIVPLAGIHDWLHEQATRGRMIDMKLYAGLYLAGCPPPPTSANV